MIMAKTTAELLAIIAELTASNAALSEGVKPFVVKINRDTGTIGIGGAGISTKWFHPAEAAVLVANQNTHGLAMLASMKALLDKHGANPWGGVGTETLCMSKVVKRDWNASDEGKAANAAKAAKYAAKTAKPVPDINA